MKKIKPFSLNEKERKFCIEYVSNGHNAMQAAMTAGYSEKYSQKSSFRLLQKPEFKDYITQLIDKVEKKIGVTFEWKVNKLRLVVERAIPDDDAQYDPINEVPAGVGIQAIQELNKMQGHHSAEKHVNTNVSADTDIESVKTLMDELIVKYNKEY